MTQDCNSNIEKQIKEIWRSTFGDTPAYVDLLFNAYFSENLSQWITLDGKVAACGIGIPYDFVCCNGEKFRGLYLCGLATVPEMRCQGLMTRLLEEMEENARKRGFDATFLIPADEELRNFYAKRGYKNTSKRLCLSLEKGEEIDEKGQNSRRKTEYPEGKINVEERQSTQIGEFFQNTKFTIFKGNFASISEFAELASRAENLYNNTYSSSQKNIVNKIQNIVKIKESDIFINKLQNKINSEISNNINNRIHNNTFFILHNKSDFETIIREKILSGSLIIIGYENNIISFCEIIDKDGKVWPIIGELKLHINLLAAIYNYFSNIGYNSKSISFDSEFLEELNRFLKKIESENEYGSESDESEVEEESGNKDGRESGKSPSLKLVIDDPDLINRFESIGENLLRYEMSHDSLYSATMTLRCEVEDFGMIKFLNGESKLIRENRIFESDCAPSRKYSKNEKSSKIEENQIANPQLVSFRLMLD